MQLRKAGRNNEAPSWRGEGGDEAKCCALRVLFSQPPAQHNKQAALLRVSCASTIDEIKRVVHCQSYGCYEKTQIQTKKQTKNNVVMRGMTKRTWGWVVCA